jgi:Tfp pilus assembly protein PilF
MTPVPRTAGGGDDEDFFAEVLTPQSANVLLSMNPRSATAELLLGTAYLGQGDAAEARKAFRRALELDPACLAADIGISRTYAREGRRNAATQYVQVLLEKYDDDYIRSYLHFLLGAYHQKTDSRASLRQYERAAELNPNVQQYWTWLGLGYITTKQLDRAEVALRRSLQIGGSGKSAALAYIGLAEVAHRRGAPEAEVYALLVKSHLATWIKPPADLLPYLKRNRLILHPEVSAQR